MDVHTRRVKWFSKIDKHFTKLKNNKKSSVKDYIYSTYEVDDTCEVLLEISFVDNVHIKEIQDIAKYLNVDDYNLVSRYGYVCVPFYFEDV